MRLTLSVFVLLTAFGSAGVDAQEATAPPGAGVPATDASPPPAEKPAADPLAMKMKWKNGPYFYSEDGLFTFQPGGRFQFDTVLTAVPAGLRRAVPGPSQFEDGVSIRRARFAADGTLLKAIDWTSGQSGRRDPAGRSRCGSPDHRLSLGDES